MENDKPLEADISPTEAPAGSQVAQEAPVVDPLDPVVEKGGEDVKPQGEEAMDLTLADLNTLAGREGDNAFKSKADYEKHYKNLTGLVGDPEARKENNAPKKEEEESIGDKALREVETLKGEIAKKDFLLEQPTAKDHMDVLEAYADKNDIGLGEAWEKIGSQFATSGDSKQIKTNNRINQVQSQKISDLAKAARSGDDVAQENLVEEYLGTGKGNI